VNQKTYHQILIDVPRTNPAVPQFQQPTAQQVLERVLYIWAIRHPGSGYVQGMNDLATPFFAVFLTDYTGERCLCLHSSTQHARDCMHFPGRHFVANAALRGYSGGATTSSSPSSEPSQRR